MILPIVASVLTLAGSIATLTVNDEADDLIAGAISEDEFRDAYTGPSVLQSVALLPLIAAVVVSLILCSRVAGNHRALGRRTTWSPGMAVGGWFLPPFLFVIPMLFMHESWRAADPGVAPGDDRWRSGGANPMVFVWWVLYGIVPLAFIPVLLEQFRSFNPDMRDLAEMVQDIAPLQVASSAVQVVAATSWAVLIAQLIARHRQLTGEARR